MKTSNEKCPGCEYPIDPVGKYDPDSYDEGFVPVEYFGEVWHEACVREDKRINRREAEEAWYYER